MNVLAVIFAFSAGVMFATWACSHSMRAERMRYRRHLERLLSDSREREAELRRLFNQSYARQRWRERAERN